MNEEIMQLISLVKNDEEYFKRIEELKKKQLEVAHVLEIAKTLKQAEMYLANARQNGDELIEEAKRQAENIKESALSVVADAKAKLEKNRAKEVVLKEREEEVKEIKDKLVQLERTMNDSITEHRRLSAERTLEQDAAKKIRNEFEDKLRKLKEVATS